MQLGNIIISIVGRGRGSRVDIALATGVGMDMRIGAIGSVGGGNTARTAWLRLRGIGVSGMRGCGVCRGIEGG